jgi:hypothetical protein
MIDNHDKLNYKSYNNFEIFSIECLNLSKKGFFFIVEESSILLSSGL